MTIETKYNIGDKVLAGMAFYRMQPVKIKGIYISIESNGYSISYEVVPIDGWEAPIRTSEYNLFPTKEELLKSL